MPSHDNTPSQPQSRPADAPHKPRQPLIAALRARWDTAWEDNGPLHRMWEDILRAPADGLRQMAPWLRAVLALTGLSFVVLLAKSAADVALQALHQLLTAVPQVQVGTDTSHGVFAVVDGPIRTYIAVHSATLPISASTLYTVWQGVGLFALIGGFFRSSGARLTWTAWGAASVAMVHSAAPADGRTIATGLAVLAWTAASTLALRGLTLRPEVFTHIDNAAPRIEPHIHLPAPAAPPAEDAPDNVRPLPQR